MALVPRRAALVALALLTLLVPALGATPALADAVPTLSVSVDQPVVPLGGTVTVTATATLPDGSLATGVTLLLSGPFGWSSQGDTGTLSQQLPDVTDGQTLTLQMTDRAGAVLGQTQVSFRVATAVRLATAAAPAPVPPYAAVPASLVAPGTGLLELQRRRAGTSSWQRVQVLSLEEQRSSVTGSLPPLQLWAPGAGVWELRAVRPDSPTATPSESEVVHLRVTGAAPAWLVALNTLRRQAGSPPAYWSPRADADALLHARWMVRNGQICHCEVKGTPLYSAKGDAVGAASWLSLGSAGYGAVKDPVSGVRGLAAAPFHSVGMLAATLRGVALATARYGSLASVVVYGVDVAPVGTYGFGTGATGQVLTYPGNGATVPAAFTRTPSETPDPVARCGAGYAPGVSGAPLWASWGLRSAYADPPVPQVSLTSATLTSGGARLAVCAYDLAHYRGSSVGETRYAQVVLAPYQAVVVVPKAPLVPGRRYTVTVTTNLGVHSWSFQVGR